jgi:hypothetical protein
LKWERQQKDFNVHAYGHEKILRGSIFESTSLRLKYTMLHLREIMNKNNSRLSFTLHIGVLVAAQMTTSLKFVLFGGTAEQT